MSFALANLTSIEIEKIIQQAKTREWASKTFGLGGPKWTPGENIDEIELELLECMVSDLTLVAQAELLALSLLGKGAIGVDLSRWEELLEVARAQAGVNGGLASSLVMTENLSFHLQNGLDVITGS